jgi:hypothetical protein
MPASSIFSWNHRPTLLTGRAGLRRGRAIRCKSSALHASGPPGFPLLSLTRPREWGGGWEWIVVGTVSGLAKVAIFTTNVDAENQCLINH